MPIRYTVLILVLAALAHPLPALAAIHYVDADAIGANDGSSWADAFVDLQDALAVVVYGDEVWVAAGVYKPTSVTDRSATFELVNGVALYGGFVGVETDRSQRDWVLNETVLSGDIGVQGDEVLELWQKLSPDRRINEEALDLLRSWSKHAEAVKEGSELATPSEENSIHVVTAIDVDETCILDGFDVAYGAATTNDDAYSRHGGGMLIIGSSLRIANTVIRDNQAWNYGGGVAAVEGSHPYFENVSVAGNRVFYHGGGVSLDDSAITIHGSTFDGNFASIRGGGLVQDQSSPEQVVTLVYVEFRGNIGDDGCGGLAAGEVFVLNSVFDDNWTQREGGGACASGTFINVLFSRNRGEGIHVQSGGGGLIGGGTLVNVAFVDNSTLGHGGGFFGSGTLTNVTCVGNTSYSYTGEGGGIYLEGGKPATLTNTIAWGNDSSHTEHGQIYSEDGQAVISRSLVQGSLGSGPHWNPSMGQDGGGNIDADPRFVDSDNGDVRLQLSSPAIDMGDSDALPGDVTADLDGNPRLSGRHVDIGAYELQCEPFEIAIGEAWDGTPLQEIFDTTYGPGAIDAATDYSGTACGDPIQAYWLDTNVSAWLVREIASNSNANVFGWHAENFSLPVIDGIDDGVIFTGPLGSGATAMIAFPTSQRFGFYLDPNGPGDATNAPQPEHFFTNRLHNDAGPDGDGAPHQPAGGDVQCLIYDISHLRGGVPTYVLAWEDLDAGSPVTAMHTTTSTDNDYNDLVVEIQAESPVPAIVASLDARMRDRSVELRWELQGTREKVQYEIQRRPAAGAFETIAVSDRAQWTDDSLTKPGRYEYRIAARFEFGSVYSQATSIDFAPGAGVRSGLVRAVPNPFNPATRIEFELAERSDVGIRIFDLAGREVRRFELRDRPAGSGTVDWNGTDSAGRSVAAGSYIVQLVGGSMKEGLRVVLIK